MDFTTLLPALIIILVLITAHIICARYRLKQWAQQRQYILQKCRFCLTDIGPYSYLDRGGKRAVFKIDVLDQAGRNRSGYARIGGFLFGMLCKQIEVKWDSKLLDE